MEARELAAPGELDEDELRALWANTLATGDDLETLSVTATYGRPAAAPGADTGATLPALTVSLAGETLAMPHAGATQAGLASGAHYELVSEIGRGGMGVVWRARQSSLAREVAVKTVRQDLRGGAREPIFVAEARVTGSLDHPNIVPVHELGRTQTGEVFLAMKLVGGTSWRELLHPTSDESRARAAGFDRRRHFEVLLGVCNALCFAHDRGVVHCDLKPDNVMVGDYGEVLVMDWGIAVDVRDAPDVERHAPHRSTITTPRGTPAYMPPELAAGRGELVGPWTDVYLLGAILCEITSGRPPHRGTTLVDVLRAALASEPPRLDADAAGERVPAALRAICQRALAREPAARYASVAALQAALREYLGHEESIRMADEAVRALARLLERDAVPRAERYGEFTRVGARFTEALHLWPENAGALAGEARALAAFADEALARGDVGLAAAQLERLGSNRAAEPERVRALAAAVRARTRLLARAALGGAVVVLIAALAALALDRWRERLAGEDARSALERSQSEEVARAWDAVRDGKPDELATALTALRRPELAATRDVLERTRALERAARLLAWQRGAHRELLLASAPERVTGAALAALVAAPEVASSVVAELVAPLASAKGVAGRALLARLALAAELGAPPAALSAALAALAAPNAPDAAPGLAADTATGPTRDPVRDTAQDAAQDAAQDTAQDPAQDAAQHAAHDTAHGTAHGTAHDATPADELAALRATALLSIARDAALERGDLAAARELDRLRTPFRQEAPGGADAPRAVRAENGDWVALDPSSGAVRWTSPVLGEEPGPAWALAAGDGALVVAGNGQVVRLAGVDGSVLARVSTAAPVMLLAPDPCAPSALLLVLATDGPRGWFDELRLVADGRGGLVPERPCLPGSNVLAQLSTRNAARTLAARLQAEAARALGVAQSAVGDDERVRARVRAELWVEAQRDPANARLLQELLARSDDPVERGELARRIAAAPPALPFAAAELAVALERAGFEAEADALLARGAARFLELGGNAALAASLLGNPVTYLRILGSEHFAAGRIERALELVESGRRFSEFVELDHRFYARYAAWLARAGRRDELRAIEARVERSREAGGVLMQRSSELVRTDIFLSVWQLSPLLVLALGLRLWWQARRARVADLYALGLRTRGARGLAFVTDPVPRLRHTFLAYASRPQRALLALACALFIAAATLSAAGVGSLGRSAALPLYAGNGLTGSDGMLRYLAEVERERGAAAPGLLLVAEGRRARGEHERARAALTELVARFPDDAAAAENDLGVLAEEAGDGSSAGAHYARAAGASAAARYNRARLARDDAARRAAQDELHHGERLHALAAPEAPLWARASYADLADVVIATPPLAIGALRALARLLERGMGALTDLGMTPDGSQPRYAQALAGYGAVLLLGLGLVWLPLPVKPLGRSAPTPGRASPLLRLRHGVALLVALGVPGLYDLVYARIALGALELLLLAVALGTRTALFGRGLIAAIALPSFGGEYFADIEAAVLPGTALLERATALVVWGLVVANVPLTLARAWRSGLARLVLGAPAPPTRAG